MKQFVDLAQIEVRAGDGGDGSNSFRREKFVPKGGPDGGQGGDGGHVYVKASANLGTLYDFTHYHKFEAEDGANGQGQKMFGKKGESKTLVVPVGTIIYEYQNPNTPDARLVKIADLNNDGEEVRIAKGGKGGRGNVAFKSSTHQAPEEFEEGTPGEHKMVVLELKAVADVGLIGFPNAGKSTLLSHLTKAKPRIADYPFTTLSPNLGVMEYYDRRIILADIPGLIEGAAEGKGLGDDFLRHVERTKVLVHLIDPFSQDAIESYEAIRSELGEYSTKLLDKPELVVINKTDITEVNELFNEIAQRFHAEKDIEVVGISAATGQGLEELKKKIVDLVDSAPEEVEEEDVQEDVPVFTIEDLKSF